MTAPRTGSGWPAVRTINCGCGRIHTITPDTLNKSAVPLDLYEQVSERAHCLLDELVCDGQTEGVQHAHIKLTKALVMLDDARATPCASVAGSPLCPGCNRTFAAESPRRVVTADGVFCSYTCAHGARRTSEAQMMPLAEPWSNGDESRSGEASANLTGEPCRCMPGHRGEPHEWWCTAVLPYGQQRRERGPSDAGEAVKAGPSGVVPQVPTPSHGEGRDGVMAGGGGVVRPMPQKEHPVRASTPREDTAIHAPGELGVTPNASKAIACARCGQPDTVGPCFGEPGCKSFYSEHLLVEKSVPATPNASPTPDYHYHPRPGFMQACNDPACATPCAVATAAQALLDHRETTGLVPASHARALRVALHGCGQHEGYSAGCYACRGGTRKDMASRDRHGETSPEGASVSPSLSGGSSHEPCKGYFTTPDVPEHVCMGGALWMPPSATPTPSAVPLVDVFTASTKPLYDKLRAEETAKFWAGPSSGVSDTARARAWWLNWRALPHEETYDSDCNRMLAELIHDVRREEREACAKECADAGDEMGARRLRWAGQFTSVSPKEEKP